MREIAAAGSGFGAYLVLFPMICGEYYGRVNFGTYYAYNMLGSSVASVVMPVIGTNFFSPAASDIYSKHGTYAGLFVGTAAALLVAGLGLLLCPHSHWLDDHSETRRLLH